MARAIRDPLLGLSVGQRDGHFLTVLTVTFDIVHVFFVPSLERRRVLHVNVTAHPYAARAAQQIVEAIGAEIVPERLIRDRDAIFGTAFGARVTIWASARSLCTLSWLETHLVNRLSLNRARVAASSVRVRRNPSTRSVR